MCCAAKPIIKRDVIEFLLKTLFHVQRGILQGEYFNTEKKKSVKIKSVLKKFHRGQLESVTMNEVMF